jgi:hypothetical protein
MFGGAKVTNRLRLSACLFCIVVGTEVSSTNAELINNGDFETGTRTGWAWAAQSNVTDAVVNFDVYGSDGNSLAIQVNLPSSAPNSPSTLSQRVLLEAGKEYSISWEQAMQNIGVESLLNAGQIEVRFGGTLLSRWSQGFLGANSNTGLFETRIFKSTISDFQEIAFSFQRASFGSPNPTLNMYIDNVSIVAVVPEPSSIGMFCFGVGLLVSNPRRKTK